MYSDIDVGLLFAHRGDAYSIHVERTNYRPVQEFDNTTYTYTPYDTDASVNVTYSVTYSANPEHMEPWEQEVEIHVDYTMDSSDGRLHISEIKPW